MKKPTKAAKKATQVANAKAMQQKALEKLNAAFDKARG
jgi:hypothetical protein